MSAGTISSRGRIALALFAILTTGMAGCGSGAGGSQGNGQPSATITPTLSPTSTTTPVSTIMPTLPPAATSIPLASASVSNISVGPSPILNDLTCYMKATITNTSNYDASNVTVSADVALVNGQAKATGFRMHGNYAVLGAGQSDIYTGQINFSNLANGNPINIAITVFENGQKIGQGATNPYPVACPSGST